MTLKVLRALENIFYNIGSYFEDWADSIDAEFHDELRQALSEPITGGFSGFLGCDPELQYHIWPGWLANLSDGQICMCGKAQWAKEDVSLGE